MISTLARDYCALLRRAVVSGLYAPRERFELLNRLVKPPPPNPERRLHRVESLTLLLQERATCAGGPARDLERAAAELLVRVCLERGRALRRVGFVPTQRRVA